MSQLTEVFERIYKEQTWQTGSGPGSNPGNVIAYRIFLEQFIRLNGYVQVTDLGCGDWQFSRFVDWSPVHYVGFDVVPQLIENNKRNYENPNIKFNLFGTIADLPGGDLLLAKEVLQHLPNNIVTEYLAVIRERYKAALITNTVGPRGHGNGDAPVGGVRSLRLDEPPFAVRGATVLSYDFVTDGVLYHNETFLMFGN